MEASPEVSIEAIAAAASATDAARRAADLITRALGVPVAILRRIGATWRFEADAAPPLVPPLVASPQDVDVRVSTTAPRVASAESVCAPVTDAKWTALVLGEASSSAWILLLPGCSESWQSTPFVSGVAPRLGAALEEVSLRDQLVEARSVARALHRFSRRLLRVGSAQGLYDLILGTMARHVCARMGALALLLPDGSCLGVVATVGYPLEVVEHLRIASGEGVLGEVFATGRPALVHERQGAPRRLRYRTDAYVAVPIRGPKNVLAVAAFTDRRDGGPFNRADLNTLRLLAAPAGLALATESVRHAAAEERRLASIDPLTGLLNRRYFDRRLYAEMQRARRHGDRLALLMIDLDDFKAINDRYGHVRGDHVLRCVAERLRRSVRVFDVCMRYGGDEFAVLMPSSMPETAIAVAERIRDNVHRHCSAGGVTVTVSVGIAYSEGLEPDLLAFADRALMDAKRRGKDTVSIHDPGRPSDA